MGRVSKLAWRTSLAGVAVAAMAGLAGCNEAPPPAPPPPPAAAYQPPPPPPALLGGPPPHQFIGMAPIPNPPPGAQASGYGAHHWRHRHGDHSPGWWLRAHGYKAGAPQVVHVAAPGPTPAPPPRIVAAAPPVAAPPPVAKPSPLAQLASAVSDKWKGATLSAPADLSAKKPGAVTVSLPADLFSVIRREAAKLGLGGAAKKTDVTATLHGEGYTVTPPGPQTVSLAAGKPATFTWQVAPGPNAKGPLKADVDAVLKGAGDAQTFSLAKLKQAVAAVDAAADAAKAASHGFKFPSLDFLSLPGHKDLTLPVVGKTPSKSLVGAVIVLIVLFLLALLARGSSGRRQAEERRRYRTMAATPVAGLAGAEALHAEPVLAPTVEHEHAVAAPVAHAHDAAPAVEPPARHYEGPDLAAAHPAEDGGHAAHQPEAADVGHAEVHHPVEDHAEAAHAADHHAESVIDQHAADHGADDHHAAEAAHADHHVEAVHVVEHHAAGAHAGDEHAAADPVATADAHGHAAPVVDAHGEAPVGDYMLIADHAGAHAEVHHAEAVVDDHSGSPATEVHADQHAAADHHGHGDHHHGHDAHRHLELESI